MLTTSLSRGGDSQGDPNNRRRQLHDLILRSDAQHRVSKDGLENDDEEQAFLDTANLEEYDLTAGGAPMRKWLADYEDMYKDARVNLRLPKALVLEFKRKAAARHMPYQRLMRAVLQEAAKTL